MSVTLKDNTGNTAVASKFGGLSGVRTGTASKFVAGVWTVTDVTVRVNRDTGVPIGDVLIGIFTNSAGVPSAAQVGGYATIAVADTSGAFAVFSKTLASPAVLTTGQTYWLVFKSSATDGSSDANYYSTSSIITGPINNGAQYGEPSPSTWTNNNDDLYYRLVGTAVTEYSISADVGTFSMSLFDATLTKRNYTNVPKPAPSNMINVSKP